MSVIILLFIFYTLQVHSVNLSWCFAKFFFLNRGHESIIRSCKTFIIFAHVNFAFTKLIFKTTTWLTLGTNFQVDGKRAHPKS